MVFFCAICGALLLAIAQWLIFYYAPVEASLGLIQKIFYMHLPLAWWGLISFFLVFLASIGYLITKKTQWDNLCAAAAEIGLLFASLTLFTGMIWAKNSWGTWWTWDPRLTTTLIMCFIYAAYLIFRHLDLPPDRSRLISAVLGIIAFLDVPFVFLSARLFRSIHPAVFVREGGGMEPEMKLCVSICVIALGLFWLAMLLIRSRQLAYLQNLDKLLFSRQVYEEND